MTRRATARPGPTHRDLLAAAAGRARSRGSSRCARGLVALAGLVAARRPGRARPVHGRLRHPGRRRRRHPPGGRRPRPAVHRPELRLPQTLVAVLVGAALGLSGALTQTFARNPLASPDILGVTEGAAFGAVAVIVLAGSSGYGGGLVTGSLESVGLPLAAFAGGLVTAAAALRAVLAARDRRPAARPDRHRPRRRAHRADVLAPGQGPHPGRRQRAGLAQRLAQRPRLGARAPAAAHPGRARARLAAPGRATSTRCSSATTPPAASGVRLQPTQLLMLVAAVGLAAVAVSAVGPLELRGPRRPADRAAPHRWLAAARCSPRWPSAPASWSAPT